MKVLFLHVYPVKACAAARREEASFGPLGVEGDRRFAFVDPEGVAVTQREQPLLATVRPRLEREALHLDLGGLLDLEVPLSAFVESANVDVWSSQVPARAAAVPKAEDYLGMPLKLAMLEPAAARGFVDSQPVLVTTTDMLAALNAQLSSAIGMERFRPNAVLDGGDGSWGRLRGKDVLLERSKPCGRCEVTTIDQVSGERRGDEPLRTIHQRFGGNFGIYYTVARGGRLRVGDALEAD